MKKTYISPSVEVVKVVVSQMLAESLIPFGSGKKDGSEACGRGSNWDDEE